MIITSVIQESNRRMMFENHEYEWNGRTWFDTRTKGIPPLRVVAKLTAMERDRAR